MEQLSHSTEILIRFNEADPLGIVWHGHYVRYFEDAREAFGEKYTLGYMDFFNHGVIVPIVHIDCNYKKSIRFGERIMVEAIFIASEAAKIKFNYKLFNLSHELVATGSTTQVFLDKETRLLQLIAPPFFIEWKKKHGLMV